jgi:hypothetical protein
VGGCVVSTGRRVGRSHKRYVGVWHWAAHRPRLPNQIPPPLQSPSLMSPAGAELPIADRMARGTSMRWDRDTWRIRGYVTPVSLVPNLPLAPLLDDVSLCMPVSTSIWPPARTLCLVKWPFILNKEMLCGEMFCSVVFLRSVAWESRRCVI